LNLSGLISLGAEPKGLANPGQRANRKNRHPHRSV
jgi:hypothetical protein